MINISLISCLIPFIVEVELQEMAPSNERNILVLLDEIYPMSMEEQHNSKDLPNSYSVHRKVPSTVAFRGDSKTSTIKGIGQGMGEIFVIYCTLLLVAEISQKGL